MSVKFIPDGYHTITPYLIVKEADKLLDFIAEAFDGQVKTKIADETGRIRHAEVKIGDSMVMLAEASEEWPATETLLHLYVENADAVYQKALAAGAESVREPQDQTYGDRNATVRDSFGNLWGIATHLEEVSEEEFRKREEAKQQTAG